MAKWLFLLASTAVIFLSASFYFFSSYRDISNVFEKAEKNYELNVKKILAKKAKKHNEDKKDSKEDEALDINYGKLLFFLFFLIIVAVVVYYFF